jgi:endonuclease/exonuclease/phosphatase family metal-dependent hydrolase
MSRKPALSFGRKILWIAACCCAAAAQAAHAQTLRVMSYNIHHGCDIHEKLQLDQIAALVRKDRADIVALVEVDSVCTRSGETDQPAILSKLTGMHVAYVRHFAFQGGAYGLALLSRFPITRVTNERIPVMTDENGDSTRALLSARLRLPGGKGLDVLVAHLDYRSGESRARQADFLDHLLQGKRGPLMMLGDLNATPDSGPIQHLEARFTDANKAGDMTFPSDAPREKIDYILIDKAHFGKTLRDTVYPVQYSDHRPIAAEVTLSGS